MKKNFIFEYLDVSSPDGEITEITSKSQSKTFQVPLPINDPSPPPPPPPPSSEKSSTGGIRRPTIIPTTAKNGNQPKTSVIPPSIPTRAQQTSSMTSSTSSVSELPLSPVPAVAKRNVIPTRSISNVSQSPMISNLRSSPSNNQTSSIPMNSSTTGNNITRGGIPRLTKNSHQIVKPTTTTTGPAKRPGQVNQSFSFLFPSLSRKKTNAWLQVFFLIVYFVI